MPETEYFWGDVSTDALHSRFYKFKDTKPITYGDKSWAHLTPARRKELWDVHGGRPGHESWKALYPDDMGLGEGIPVDTVRRSQFINQGYTEQVSNAGHQRPKSEWTEEQQQLEREASAPRTEPLPWHRTDYNNGEKLQGAIGWMREKAKTDNDFRVGLRSKDVMKGFVTRMPLGFGIPEFMQAKNSSDIIDRIYEDKATAADYYAFASEIVTEELKDKDPTMTKALRGASQMPAFLADMYVTGGIATGMKAFGRKGLAMMAKKLGKEKFKSLMANMAYKAAKTVLPKVAEAGMYATVVDVGSTAANAIPQRNIELDQDQMTGKIKGFKQTDKEHLANSLLRSVTDKMIEYGVEKWTGETLVGGFRGAKNLMRPASKGGASVPHNQAWGNADDLWLAKVKDGTFYKLSPSGKQSAIGFNGMLGEIGEERVTEVLQAANIAVFGKLPGAREGGNERAWDTMGMTGAAIDLAGHTTGAAPLSDRDLVNRVDDLKTGAATEFVAFGGLKAASVGNVGGQARAWASGEDYKAPPRSPDAKWYQGDNPTVAEYHPDKDPVLATRVSPGMNKKVQKLLENDATSRRDFEAVKLPDGTSLLDHYPRQAQREGYLKDIDRLNREDADVEQNRIDAQARLDAKRGGELQATTDLASEAWEQEQRGRKQAELEETFAPIPVEEAVVEQEAPPVEEDVADTRSAVMEALQAEEAEQRERRTPEEQAIFEAESAVRLREDILEKQPHPKAEEDLATAKDELSELQEAQRVQESPIQLTDENKVDPKFLQRLDIHTWGDLEDYAQTQEADPLELAESWGIQPPAAVEVAPVEAQQEAPPVEDASTPLLGEALDRVLGQGDGFESTGAELIAAAAVKWDKSDWVDLMVDIDDLAVEDRNSSDDFKKVKFPDGSTLLDRHPSKESRQAFLKERQEDIASRPYSILKSQGLLSAELTDEAMKNAVALVLIKKGLVVPGTSSKNLKPATPVQIAEAEEQVRSMQATPEQMKAVEEKSREMRGHMPAHLQEIKHHPDVPKPEIAEREAENIPDHVIDIEQDKKDTVTALGFSRVDLMLRFPGMNIEESGDGEYRVNLPNGPIRIIGQERIDSTDSQLETQYNDRLGMQDYRLDPKGGRQQSFEEAFPTLESFIKDHREGPGNRGQIETPTDAERENEATFNVLATIRIANSDFHRADNKQLETLQHELVHYAHIGGLWSKPEWDVLVKKYAPDPEEGPKLTVRQQSEAIAMKGQEWGEPGLMQKFTDLINKTLHHLLKGKVKLKPEAVKNLFFTGGFYQRTSGGVFSENVLAKRDTPMAMAEGEVSPRSPMKITKDFAGFDTLGIGLEGEYESDNREFDPEIVDVFNSIHDTDMTPRDVTKQDPAAAKGRDYYHASPVCKNCSKAKVRRTITELDMASGTHVAETIRQSKNPVITIENVPAYQDTIPFREISDALDEGGYTWDIVVHDAADYGAAQTRKRMMVRAVLNGELPPLPKKQKGKDWYETLKDLIDDAPDSKFVSKDGKKKNDELQRIENYVAKGKLTFDKPIITMGGSASKGVPYAANAGQPSPTLLASPNQVPRIIMPDGRVKRVTPRMMARLMGISDDVKIPKVWKTAKKALGNGIHVEVTRQLIQPLLDRKPTPTDAPFAMAESDIDPDAPHRTPRQKRGDAFGEPRGRAANQWDKDKHPEAWQEYEDTLTEVQDAHDKYQHARSVQNILDELAKKRKSSQGDDVFLDDMNDRFAKDPLYAPSVWELEWLRQIMNEWRLGGTLEQAHRVVMDVNRMYADGRSNNALSLGWTPSRDAMLEKSAPRRRLKILEMVIDKKTKSVEEDEFRKKGLVGRAADTITKKRREAREAAELEAKNDFHLENRGEEVGTEDIGGPWTQGTKPKKGAKKPKKGDKKTPEYLGPQPDQTGTRKPRRLKDRVYAPKDSLVWQMSDKARRAYIAEKSRLERMRELIEGAGYTWDHKGLKALAMDAEAFEKILPELHPDEISLTAMLTEYHKGAMLSGPSTGLINFISPLAWSTYRQGLESPTAAALNSLYATVMGAAGKEVDITDIEGLMIRDYKGTLGKNLKGLVVGGAIGTVYGFNAGMNLILKDWKYKDYTMQGRHGEKTKRDWKARKAIPWWLGGNVVRAVGYGPIAITDQIMSSIITHSILAPYAQRIARHEGLEEGSKEFAQRVHELILDRSSIAWQAAMGEATEQLFQGEGAEGSMRAGFFNVVDEAKEIPLLGPILDNTILPFHKAMINLPAEGLVRIPGLGQIPMTVRMYQNFRANKPLFEGAVNAEHLAGQILFSILATVMAYMIDGDEEETLITGSLLDFDPGERMWRYTEGTVPKSSIRIGDFWWSIDKADPFASPISLWADIRTDYERRGKVDRKLSGIFIKSLFSQVSGKTVGQGVRDVQRGFSEGDWDTWLVNFTSSWIPNMYQQVTRLGQEDVGDNEANYPDDWFKELGERVLQRSEAIDAEPIIDTYGRKAKNITGWTGVKVASAKMHHGDRIYSNWNDANLDDKKVPPNPEKEYTVNGAKRRFPNKEFSEFKLVSGALNDKLVKQVISDEHAKDPDVLTMKQTKYLIDNSRKLVKKHYQDNGNFDINEKALIHKIRIASKKYVLEPKPEPVQGKDPQQNLEEEVAAWEEMRAAQIRYKESFRKIRK